VEEWEFWLVYVEREVKGNEREIKESEREMKMKGNEREMKGKWKEKLSDPSLTF
jgi:hypothetical protein